MAIPATRVSTVLGAAAGFDLTDLPTAKTELSLKTTDTSKDAWLTLAIAQVSRTIARYCSRTFQPQYLQDLFQFGRDPAFAGVRFGGSDQITLSARPALAVTSVVQALPDGNTRTLVQGTDYLADLAAARLIRLRADGLEQRWEAYPLTVQYVAGFGVMVAETGSVPGGAPYQVTVTQSEAFSCGVSVAYASGALLTQVTAAPQQGQYALDAVNGLYTFAAADAGQVLAFSYATADIPDDVVEVCLGLITARYYARGRDPNLMSQETPQVGVQRWWIGGSPGQAGEFAPDVEAALGRYRAPTVG